jgi:hypothetical protein
MTISHQHFKSFIYILTAIISFFISSIIFVLPEKETLLQTQEKTLVLQTQLIQEKHLIDKLEDYKKYSETLNNTVAHLRKILPLNENTALIVHAITHASLKNAIHILLLEPVASNGNTTFHLIVTGDYKAVQSYINTLLTSNPLLNINDFTISLIHTPKQPAEIIQGDFVVKTYTLPLSQTNMPTSFMVEPASIAAFKSPEKLSIKNNIYRDPFTMDISTPVNTVSLSGIIFPDNTLDELTLAGIIKIDHVYWALIQSPDGVERVNAHDKISQTGAEITAIDSHSVTLLSHHHTIVWELPHV